MDNASLILETLDRQLRRPARPVLYGRAALQLGFREPPLDIAESKDVDAIVPLSDLDELSANDDFWDGQEAANVVIPDLVELHDAFERAKPLVRDLARPTRL